MIREGFRQVREVLGGWGTCVSGPGRERHGARAPARPQGMSCAGPGLAEHGLAARMECAMRLAGAQVLS